MRVAFVIPYFYPALEYGGTPRSAYELARELVRRGHDVKVITTDSGGSSRLSFDVSGADPNTRDLKVFYYRNLSNYLAFRHRLFFPLRLFSNILSHLEHCDVV